MKLQALLPLAAVLSVVATSPVRAADDGDEAAGVGTLSASTFSGLRLRSIGPALMEIVMLVTVCITIYKMKK